MVLTSYLLTTALPFLVEKARIKRKFTYKGSNADIAVADFMGLISTSILIPTLRSFTPTSHSVISHLFSRTLNRVTDDIRPGLLALVQNVMNALSELTDGIVAKRMRRLREHVGLEAACELERLHFCPTVGVNVDSDNDQIKALATKDSLWYLVNVLHILFATGTHPASQPTSRSPEDYLPQNAILGCLSRLLSRILGSNHGYRTGRVDATDAGSGSRQAEDEGTTEHPAERFTDELSQGMILASMEKYWIFWYGRLCDPMVIGMCAHCFRDMLAALSDFNRVRCAIYCTYEFHGH
jgi:hypothetical protein